MDCGVIIGLIIKGVESECILEDLKIELQNNMSVLEIQPLINGSAIDIIPKKTNKTMQIGSIIPDKFPIAFEISRNQAAPNITAAMSENHDSPAYRKVKKKSLKDSKRYQNLLQKRKRQGVRREKGLFERERNRKRVFCVPERKGQLPLRKKARLPPPQWHGVEVARCGAELKARLPPDFRKMMLSTYRSDSDSKKRNRNTSSAGNSSLCPFPVRVPEWNKKGEYERIFFKIGIRTLRYIYITNPCSFLFLKRVSNRVFEEEVKFHVFRLKSSKPLPV
ncbi:hypothetical protein NPIL_123431 [Nephila pilipes]|uniref:Uncharacterized protein n=1 Tax=Nephila pilipes TaxID=299642 RepID=A0A8X6MH21_NEPPI|nr:hypothetical protein NPIL_123431 [Nephila pilipes]